MPDESGGKLFKQGIVNVIAIKRLGRLTMAPCYMGKVVQQACLLLGIFNQLCV